MKTERPDRIEFRSHPKGRGAFVTLHLDDGGWFGKYEIHATSGMTPTEVAAKVNALTMHHQKKAARLTAFGSVKRDLVAGGDRYDIIDLTIWEQGTDVLLVLRVRAADGSVLKLDRVYPTVDDIPADSEIVKMARDGAGDHGARGRASVAQLAALKQALGVPDAP